MAIFMHVACVQYILGVMVCAHSCLHVPVENSTDLWECGMSNAVDVLLFQENIISYFYMEFTLAHTTLLAGHSMYGRPSEHSAIHPQTTLHRNVAHS